MYRSLKMLGLVVTAMALSAMFASMASAQGGSGVLTTGKTSPFEHTATSIYATQEGSVTENVFVAFGKTLHCENETSTFTGSASGTDTTISITPNYKDCYEVNSSDLPGAAITVTTNGCTFKFNQTIETGTEDKTWEGTVDVVCPAEKVIEVEAYTGTPTEHGSLVLCKDTIGAQKGLSKVTYHNIAGSPDDITVEVEAGGIAAVQEGLCGPMETKTATYTSKLTLTSGTPGKPGTDDVWISTGT